MLLTSCNEDFLETEPFTDIRNSIVGRSNLVRTYINNIYAGPEPFRRGRLTSNLVDEADYRGNTGSLNFNNGVITQDATPAWISMYYDLYWADFYKRIRYCNVFLKNKDRINSDDDALKDEMEREARFLRAYLYHKMISIWWGSDYYLMYMSYQTILTPRASYEDCVNFIVEECDRAANLLPEIQDGADGAVQQRSRVIA